MDGDVVFEGLEYWLGISVRLGLVGFNVGCMVGRFVPIMPFIFSAGTEVGESVLRTGREEGR